MLHVLHENVAPEAPVAVNSVLPQLLATDTPGAAGMALTVNKAALEVNSARYVVPYCTVLFVIICCCSCK